MNIHIPCPICGHSFSSHRSAGVYSTGLFAPTEGLVGYCSFSTTGITQVVPYTPCNCNYYIDCLKEEESGALRPSVENPTLGLARRDHTHVFDKCR